MKTEQEEGRPLGRDRMKGKYRQRDLGGKSVSPCDVLDPVRLRPVVRKSVWASHPRCELEKDERHVDEGTTPAAPRRPTETH